MSSFSSLDSNHPNASAQAGSNPGEAAVTAASQLLQQARSQLQEGADALRDRLQPPLNHAADQASDLAHDGLDTLRHRSRQALDGAHRISDLTAGYVRHQPLKSVLIALAGGALLMAVVGLVRRNRH